jgi:hypothetical protein
MTRCASASRSSIRRNPNSRYHCSPEPKPPAILRSAPAIRYADQMDWRQVQIPKKMKALARDRRGYPKWNRLRRAIRTALKTGGGIVHRATRGSCFAEHSGDTQSIRGHWECPNLALLGWTNVEVAHE